MADVHQDYDDARIVNGLAAHLALDLGENVTASNVTVKFDGPAGDLPRTAEFIVTLLWSVDAEDARVILRAAEV